MSNKLFEFNQTPSHYVITLFGIRAHLLRPELQKRRKEYKAVYTNVDINSLPETEESLRLVQTANLGLLRILDKLCKENNITYWLDFGTLLGAKRHKGFIPWDDDVDIGMPREDYERFFKLFGSEIEGYPDIFCAYFDNSKNKCFLKLKHKKSENLSIDIFPYDYYYKPVNKEEKIVLSKKIAKLVKPKLFKRFKSHTELLENFKKLTKKHILKGNKVDKTTHPALFWGIDFPHGWKNKVYDYENIFPIGQIEFENKLFPCPNMTHEVLTSVYGDYMQIPKNVYPRHAGTEISDEEKMVMKSLSGEMI